MAPAARRSAAGLGTLLVLLLTGCSPSLLRSAPEGLPSADARDRVARALDLARAEIDSAAAESAPVESTAVAAVDTAGAPPPQAAPAAPRPSEPWILRGESLAGSIEGPIEVDLVDLRHEGLVIRAVRGLIDPDERRAELHGEVSIEDSLRVIHGDRAFYYRDEMLLRMEGNVRGHGPEGIFQSRELIYNRREGVLTLSDHVTLEEEGRNLDARWVRYVRDDSLMTAGGGIRLREMADSVDVYGDLLTYDRARGKALIVPDGASRPRLVQGGTDTEPPFEAEADTLLLWTEERTGEAFGDVVFERGTVHGTCERAFFHLTEDRLVLVGEPRVDDPDGWVAGDTMAVHLRSGRADKLDVWGATRAEYYPPGRSGEAHYTVGDTLSAFLEGGAIQQVVVRGRAEALYLPAKTDVDAGIGLNWTRSRRLRLLMHESGIERVQFEGDVEGRYVLPQADSLRAAPDSMPPLNVAQAVRERVADRTVEIADSLVARLGFELTEAVGYRGDRIDFEVESDQIVIEGAGHVTYQESELEAEEITFDSGRDLVIARGEPVLKDPGSEVHGEEMTYRIDNRKGLVFMGRTEFDGGYYRAERVKRVDRRTLYASACDYTTCDLEEPHFHFHSRRMKITPGERAVAQPVILYLGNIPILAIPYAVFPTRRGRQSGLLIPDVEFGFDTSRGRFLRNVGYYWAPNDYSDHRIWLDYVERSPSLKLELQSRYKLRYVLSGSVGGSFTQDRSSGRRRDRWHIRVNHDQTLGERFSLKASGSFQSDKDYGDDRTLGADVDERINRVLRSQLSLAKSWSGASISVTGDRTEYLDDSGGTTRISQTVPSINFNLNSMPLGEKPDSRGRGGRLPWLSSMYFRGDAKLRNTYKKTWDDEVTEARAAGITASLSDKRRLLGSLNLTPRFSLRAAWADKDTEGKPNPVGMTWSSGLSASSTLYGTWFPRWGALEGVRHVIELGSTYSYSPENKSVEDFPSVGGISLSSSKSSSVSLRMTQRLHLKLKTAEEERKKENLLVWSASTSYNFLAKERGSEPWSSMSHSVDFRPGGPFTSRLGLTHDLKKWKRSRLSINTSLRLRGGGATREAPSTEELGGFGQTGSMPTRPEGISEGGARSLTGPWSLSMTHVFSMGEEWSSHRSSINISSDLSLSKSWRLSYSVYYDVTEQEVSSQGYTLVRDLHCWRAFFERHSRGGTSTYYFRINVKDLPDIKHERHRTD